MFILRNRLLKALSCLTKKQLNNTTSNTINHNNNNNNNNIQLGRWNINYDEEKLTTIIRLANEDHCGVCNEIQITQPRQLQENSHNYEQHKAQHKPQQKSYQYQKSQQESYEKIYILDDINVNRECVIKLVCCGKECSNCKYVTKLNKEKLKL
jgi:replication-associated recombination protein RarA